MIFFFLRLLARDDTFLTSSTRCLAMSAFVVAKIRPFVLTIPFGVLPRICGTRMRYESDRIRGIVRSGLRCWMLSLSIELFRVMKKCDVDPGMDLFCISACG